MEHSAGSQTIELTLPLRWLVQPLGSETENKRKACLKSTTDYAKNMQTKSIQKYQ